VGVVGIVFLLASAALLAVRQPLRVVVVRLCIFMARVFMLRRFMPVQVNTMRHRVKQKIAASRYGAASETT